MVGISTKILVCIIFLFIFALKFSNKILIKQENEQKSDRSTTAVVLRRSE